MRSCQPGPSAWNFSSTSWSRRSETTSLAPGLAAGALGAGSTGLVVAALKAASAACFGLPMPVRVGLIMGISLEGRDPIRAVAHGAAPPFDEGEIGLQHSEDWRTDPDEDG